MSIMKGHIFKNSFQKYFYVNATLDGHCSEFNNPLNYMPGLLKPYFLNERYI